MENIDFVIPWVDGNDPSWQAEFDKFSPQSSLIDSSTARYRDWDNLRYWFRAVEKFTPWLRRIHFITWGHTPSWMNTQCDKLHIVNHKDFIPSKYLPTFSCHPIELNMHLIEGLAERFVYLNDDTFIGHDLLSTRFFKDGLPCDNARLSIIADSSIDHIILNDVKVINRRYNKNQMIGHNISGWFNPRYSVSDMTKTATLMPWGKFSGFKDSHMPQPFLRSTFKRMWSEEFEILDATSKNKFRSLTDVNQYLMRYEQLVRGEFIPSPCRDTVLDTLSEQSIENIVDYIENQRYAMFCLNDSNDIVDFESIKQRLNSSFEKILNKKSCYEL